LGGGTVERPKPRICQETTLTQPAASSEILSKRLGLLEHASSSAKRGQSSAYHTGTPWSGDKLRQTALGLALDT
jgi:hypothetical protein